MNILVTGGSLSRGPDSWSYHIEKEFASQIVNLSQSGCGNTYTHETTIAELTKRSYDLAIIQWTPFIRIDYKVKDINLFKDSIYTSAYQSQQNDWTEKIIHSDNHAYEIYADLIIKKIKSLYDFSA